MTSRARPEAAARSAAQGPGEDAGEAFTLDGRGRSPITDAPRVPIFRPML